MVVLCVFSVGYFVGLTVAQTGTITIEPNSFQTEASYVIFIDGTIIKARNGTTGAIDYSGTDATSVIQSAINALTNGGKIFIKNSVYPAVITIKNDNVVLEGESWNTILKFPDHYGVSAHTIRIESNNVVVRNLQVDGNKANNPELAGDSATDGIEYYGNYTLVENCYVHDTITHGIIGYVTNHDNIVRGNFVKDSTRSAIDMAPGERNVIVNNRVSFTTATALAYGITVHTGDNIVIAGNVIEKADISISVHDGANRVSIVNNVMRDGRDSGISDGGVVSYDMVIMGNVIENCCTAGFDDNRAGIKLGNTQGATIVGNSIKGCGSHGIRLYSSSNIGDIISGNNILSPTGGGIVAEGTKHVITNNRVVSPGRQGIQIPSASSVEVSNNYVEGSYYNLFGVYASSDITLEGNIGTNNTSEPGIRIYGGSARVLVLGNRIISPKTDGVKIEGSNDSIITNNILSGAGGYDVNIADATSNRNMVIGNTLLSTNKLQNLGTDTKIRNNIGFVTENSGAATIANGEYIAHGIDASLNIGPTNSTVTVTPYTVTYAGVPVVVGCPFVNGTHIQISAYWTNGTAITADAIQVWWKVTYP
jgi:hypothetical protein